MEIKQKKRNEIPDRYKWKPEHVFPTDDAWRKAADETKTETEAFEKFQGTLTNGAAIFACLEKYFDLEEMNGKVYLYCRLKKAEDTNIAASQAMWDIADGINTDVNAAAAFIKPEILQHDPETIRGFISATPGLKKYEHYLENIMREKAHVRSAEVEEVLANAEEIGYAAEDIYDILISADLKFGSITDENGNTVEVTDGRYGNLKASPYRRVRKDVFETFWASYWQLKNTFARMLSSGIKKDVFFAKTRKYASSLDQALSESNIPRAVYENLIATVHEFIPVLQRYFAVRKKALGLDELHMYDRYAPLVDGVETKIPYEDAKNIMCEGLAALGEKYIADVKHGLEAGWIDVYESEGKSPGGFQTGAYGIHPYILMNYEDRILDLGTLAHEFGHAMHDYYAYQVQPNVYSDAPVFTAEVASTVNEVLMMEHLIATATCPKTRIYLIDEYLTQFRETMFRQTLFAEFEMITHRMVEEDEPLTLESLNEVYRGLNEKYYAPAMVIDPDIDIEWAWIPHFYMSFYVYQYSTGFAAALAFAKKLQSGCPQALEDYLGFLKAGDSDYPIEVLKKAGVDMSTPQPVRDALQVFERLVGELEKCFE